MCLLPDMHGTASIYVGGLGCPLLLKGVLHLHAYRHALCQCACCTGVLHALFAHLYGDCVPHIHTYRHTLVSLHICPEIGMLVYVVYKPILTRFTSTNMLVYMLTDTCSSFMHVCGDQTFFTACFTNLHLEGLNQCPRIRQAQAHIYTKYIHKEIELFIVMVYTHTLVDTHTRQYCAVV